MDKNTIIGIILIILILIGFNWLNRPSKEQLAEQQHRRDSLAMVEQQVAQARMEQNEASQSHAIHELSDSARVATYGAFASVVVGQQQNIDIQTEKLHLIFDTKGGYLRHVELKEFVTGDSLPLVLFDNADENTLNFTLLTSNNRVMNTADLYFEPQPIVQTDTAQLFTMRLRMDSSAYMDFVYTIPQDDYMIHLDIVPHNMAPLLDPMTNVLEMHWHGKIRQQEKGRKFESRYATLNFRYAADGSMKKLSETKNDVEAAVTPVQWIAFKDQFFSTVLIADRNFTSATLHSEMMADTSRYMKTYTVDAVVPFDLQTQQAIGFRIFFGPNHYKVLASYDKNVDKTHSLHLEEIVPLGWKAFRWVSKWGVIPLFNFFGRFISNYGIIILLMTIVIKMILLPLTFKSYMSTAKMRVLKPQIDEINKRIPAEKALERQQATMALYRKVGASPMSGCLPVLLQMPILVAMFQFFPTAFELRQEPFLWAKDLSSFDAIVSWNAYIPLITNTMGNHISLFCLLMTITNLIYTKLNMSNTAGNEQQMAMMKWMMYLMPIMFFFMFNNYASGLSYYYFVSLLFTILQTYLFRLFVNEEKLLKKLEARKGKPQKKSGFMQRLEAAQREQQRRLQERNKRPR